MHKDIVFKKGGKDVFRVDEIKNLKISNYIHPDYLLDTENIGVLGETALLIIFKLIPINDQRLPYFLARWDENSGTLDVDIKNVSKDVSNLFKAEKAGYSGHHPERILQESRTYDVNIKLPEKEIFRGNVTFNINHSHHPDLFK